MLRVKKEQVSGFNDTPTKKVKLNEFSTFEESNQLDCLAGRKVSIFDKLCVIGKLKKRQSKTGKPRNSKYFDESSFKISSFNEGQLQKNDSSDSSNKDSHKMLDENFEKQEQPSSRIVEEQLFYEDNIQIEEEQELNKDFNRMRMTKKHTCGPSFSSDLALNFSLNRNNSTFESANQQHSIEKNKLGDNVYIRQLIKHQEQAHVHQLVRAHLHSNSNQMQPVASNLYEPTANNAKQLQALNSKHNHIEHHNTSQRLNQDYQIQEETNHQNYICFNKLERIFYYVKKVNFQHQNIFTFSMPHSTMAMLHSNQPNTHQPNTHQPQRKYKTTNSYDFLIHLINMQSKIYHRDADNKLLRFYQMWVEKQSIYMTFEVAESSLEEYNFNGIRIKEHEAWEIIRDCASTLNWLLSINTEPVHHLNLKPGNIIRCKNKYKLTDFYGNQNVLQEYLKDTNYVNRMLPYLAPELKNFSNYLLGLNFQKCDIYSLGICIIQNLLGSNFIFHEHKDLRKMIESHMKGYSPALIKTIIRMINFDPKKRPTSSQLSTFNGSYENEKKRSLIRRYSI